MERKAHGAKHQVRVAFHYFWPTFTSEHFREFFPFVYDKYDLVPSHDPEVIFYSVFSPEFSPSSDPQRRAPFTRYPKGKYIRVFFTGENFEPDLANCEFAISFSTLIDSPNHLRLPLWVYENRAWGYGPERLVKEAGTDWDKIANEKTLFCNFIYRNQVPYRNIVFENLHRYKRIDAGGSCLNNMSGWTVPRVPNRLVPKVEFLRQYKFTLAVENMIWPGYMTEKLVDPMYAASIPIYVGDPKARLSFNPESYIDFSCFKNLKEMNDFVREVDNSDALYLKMLAAPFYLNNEVPRYARDETTLAFFDRIFDATIAGR